MSEKFQLVLDVAQKAQVPSPGGGSTPTCRPCRPLARSSVTHT